MKNFVSMLAVLAVFALSGCSAPTDEVPSVQTTTESVNAPVATPAPSSETPTPSNEDVFVRVIRAEYDPGMSDAELVKLGRDTCAAFDTLGVENFVKAMFNSGSDTDPELLGYVMGASAMAFCPEYVKDIGTLG